MHLAKINEENEMSKVCDKEKQVNSHVHNHVHRSCTDQETIQHPKTKSV